MYYVGSPSIWGRRNGQKRFLSYLRISHQCGIDLNTEVNLLIREHEMVTFFVLVLNGSDLLSVVEQLLYKLLFSSITGNSLSMSDSEHFWQFYLSFTRNISFELFPVQSLL